MNWPARAAGFGGLMTSCIALAVTAGAQPDQSAPVTVTMSGLVPVPVGPLIDNRNVGIGATAGLRYAPATSSPFAMRLEASGLLPSSHENGKPNMTPHVTNGSSALFATVGPEFDIPAAGGHFCTTAGAGVAHIWASSSAFSGPTPAFGPFYTLTHRQATNLAWGAGGGLVTPRSRSGFAADIGVRYLDLGRATYTTSYPSVEFGAQNVLTKAFSTTGRHQTTLVTPSVGVSWAPTR